MLTSTAILVGLWALRNYHIDLLPQLVIIDLLLHFARACFRSALRV